MTALLPTGPTVCRRRHTLIACCLLLLGSLLALPPAWAGNSLRVGKPAPPVALLSIDGQTLDTSAMTGQVVVVTFWATWCGACLQELPLLSAYAKTHAAEGLRVVGISLDTPDNMDAVRTMARQLSFPVGLLGSDRIAGYGRIWRLPVSFVIDRQGRLVDNGWNDDQPALTGERLEQQVTPLLAKP